MTTMKIVPMSVTISLIEFFYDENQLDVAHLWHQNIAVRKTQPRSNFTVLKWFASKASLRMIY